MVRPTDPEDEWEDNFDTDPEEEPTVPCPHCRRQIHEDAQRCPYCEHYLSDEETTPGHKPWWIIAGVLACLYVVYRWIAG
jgi:hypothetical protein